MGALQPCSAQLFVFNEGEQGPQGQKQCLLPKPHFQRLGLVAPCQAELSPASPHTLVTKGSRHPTRGQGKGL